MAFEHAWRIILLVYTHIKKENTKYELSYNNIKQTHFQFYNLKLNLCSKVVNLGDITLLTYSNFV